MITRDEAQQVAAAIESVRGIVSEIVVVDTGSSDDTVALARAQGASVTQISWNDDFAAARNAALSRCTRDWILVLDADERIAGEDLPRLQQAAMRSAALALVQRHYVTATDVRGFIPCGGEAPLYEKGFPGYFETSTVRFFPRHTELRYRGRVHETVEPGLRELGITVAASAIRIHHFGAVRPERLARKSELYLRLGEQKVRELGGWQALFELAIEYRGAGRLEDAANALIRAHRLNPSEQTVLVNLGWILTELGRTTDAERVLKRAVELNEFNADAHNNLGVLYLRVADHAKAALHLQRAVELHPWNVTALCNLARNFLAQGDACTAEQLYQQATEIVESHAPAWLGLGIIRGAEGKMAEARADLEKAVQYDPGCSRSRYYLGRALQQLGVYEEATAALREFCRLERVQQSSNYSPQVEQVVKAVEAELLALS